ncbi:surf1 family protein [Cystoisospora suis]|uniref:SURF1-like protein n=1 Tax=Cystoisospora suis TaxID=483139 RepID=A0A2C6KLN5_9APIC|nr:surf1 family protein [Cystoisospora suis]
MPGQRLLPCTQKDIEILSSSSVRYPNPQEVEGGVVVRLVRLQDPVTSPVLRSVRNRQYGIRGNERWWILGVGMLGTCVLAGLGVWQLSRMQWKQKLIDYRRRQLRRPPVWIKSEPFPWVPAECGEKGGKKISDGADSSPASDTAHDREGTGTDHAAEQEAGSHSGQSALSEEDRVISERDVRAQWENSQGVSLPSTYCLSLPGLTAAPRPGTALEGCAPDAHGLESERSRLLALWAYRPVVVRGVLDTSTELVVGPRPGLEPGSPGYVFVSPLRLEDGSTLLVNKGHLPIEKARLPAFDRGVERREGPWCVREMNLKVGAAALNDGESVSSLRGQACGIDMFKKQSRDEPPGWVTVRGVLDPGETPNTTWSSLLAGNRSKEGQFIFLVPVDLVDGLRPGSVKNRRSCAAMLVNAYDIVYDEDLLEAQERRGTLKDGSRPPRAQAPGVHAEASSRIVLETAQGLLNGEVTEANVQHGLLTPSMSSAGISDTSQDPSAQVFSQPLASPATVSKSVPGLHDPSSPVALLGLSGVRRRFSDYQQKRRDDYLLFWADEHTHFNYACQWFVMALCAASMTLYKFVQVSRWRW